ncbi:MAG TPA: hypothetical protein VFP84_24110 [Kofleriaceae bacterium]|nr:hypothetical protein [Kofleriaceae bacterium]
MTAERVKTVLHLVRRDATPAVVAAHDWVVYLHPTRLAQGGTPHTAPLALGAIDHDQLVALVFAADLVVTW